MNKKKKKNCWRNSEKSSIFFNLFINPFPLSHMQYFNKVAKLEHKYTELANKHKIFSAVSGNADKNYSDRGRFTKGDRGRFTKGNRGRFIT